MNNVRLSFARNQFGRVASIHEVPNGLACNCNCPSCGARLVAKQGAESAWHFAHYGVTPCATGYETALHLAAKQLIADASTLQLPPCWIARYPKGTRAPDSTIAGYWYLHGLPSSEYIAMWREAYVGFANAEAASVRFDRVELETALGDIRAGSDWLLRRSPLADRNCCLTQGGRCQANENPCAGPAGD